MRLLAIGDIHGCRSSLDTLLNFVQPLPDDLIVTLGDYVDRGPDSKGVLNRLIELHERHTIVSLKGNHELMMMAARDGRDPLRGWLLHGGSEALESYREPGRHVSLDDIPERHWHLLDNICRPYYETDRFIFVHANLKPNLPLEKQLDDDLFWQPLNRNWYKPHFSGKTMICGHTPQHSGLPLVVPGAICIDTWAYGDGWLTCLDVLNGQYWQANELGESREGMLEVPGLSP